MYEVVLKTDSQEEVKKFEQIASMILTAKAHGYADIKISVQEGKLVFGSLELKSRWA